MDSSLPRPPPSFWARFRRRPHPPNSATPEISRMPPTLPVDVLNLLLDEFISNSRESRRIHGLIASDSEYGTNSSTAVRTPSMMMVGEVLASAGLGNVRPRRKRADPSAILGKCRQVVYKPVARSMLRWSRNGEKLYQNECPVCLDRFVAKDQLLLLPCHHRFHTDCLTPWIETNRRCCPLCRADILEASDAKLNTPATPTAATVATNFGRSLISFCFQPRSILSQHGYPHSHGHRHQHSLGHRHQHSHGNRHQHSHGHRHRHDHRDGVPDLVMAALTELNDELNRLMP